MRESTVAILIISGILLLFALVFGAILLERKMRTDCAIAMHDKPAAEIQAICK